jgi:hypothetical protein
MGKIFPTITNNYLKENFLFKILPNALFSIRSLFTGKSSGSCVSIAPDKSSA